MADERRAYEPTLSKISSFGSHAERIFECELRFVDGRNRLRVANRKKMEAGAHAHGLSKRSSDITHFSISTFFVLKRP